MKELEVIYLKICSILDLIYILLHHSNRTRFYDLYLLEFFESLWFNIGSIEN